MRFQVFQYTFIYILDVSLNYSILPDSMYNGVFDHVFYVCRTSFRSFCRLLFVFRSVNSYTRFLSPKFFFRSAICLYTCIDRLNSTVIFFLFSFGCVQRNQNICRLRTIWPQNINSIDFGIDKRNGIAKGRSNRLFYWFITC